MTGAAIVRQSQLHMRRILAVGKVGGVAGETCGRSSLERIVHVARRAGQRGVGSGQGIAGNFQVIELGVEPGVHRVAAFACGGKARGHVIEDRSMKVLLVTTDTGSG